MRIIIFYVIMNQSGTTEPILSSLLLMKGFLYLSLFKKEEIFIKEENNMSTPYNHKEIEKRWKNTGKTIQSM